MNFASIFLLKSRLNVLNEIFLKRFFRIFWVPLPTRKIGPFFICIKLLFFKSSYCTETHYFSRVNFRSSFCVQKIKKSINFLCKITPENVNNFFSSFQKPINPSEWNFFEPFFFFIFFFFSLEKVVKRVNFLTKIWDSKTLKNKE